MSDQGQGMTSEWSGSRYRVIMIAVCCQNHQQIENGHWVRWKFY